MDNKELLLDENRFSEYGPEASRTQESNKSSDEMDKKDDEIAHLRLLTKPDAWGLDSNLQFASDTIRSGIFVFRTIA